ncbi:unnamed protein product [Sphagnum balticum]
MGPPVSSGYCYDSNNPLSSQWNCSCVIVQQFSTCTLATNAPMFPFGWNQTRSLVGSNQIAQYCSTPVVQSSISNEGISLSAQISTTGAVYSVISNWYAFLQDLCQTSYQWVGWTDYRNVRISSDYGYADLISNPNSTSIPDFCDPSFENLPLLTNLNSRIAWNIYNLLVNGYQTTSAVLAAYWEAQIFGTLPTGSNTYEQPFGSRPDIIQTSDTWTLPIVKYAGTGIQLLEQVYPVLNPNESLVSDTYPPSPAFAPPPNPNTNKLPVYFISPVELSYAPTITIQLNDGPAYQCQVNGTLCSVPLGYQNFSSELNVQLSTDWVNLLPAERYIVGDYSYDLGTGQTVYDVPEALLPLVYSRERQCNNLLYLFQPRTSVFTNNTLFNIPDTDFSKPISGADWSSWYQANFDATCACESALDYARTVDSQGQCENDSDGLFDMCVIMQAFRVTVPNYVTALMSFQPYSYTVQATFTVPKGNVIQYVSTSCPTGYNITKPGGTNGNTHIIFTTNQTTPQKIVIQITQFADSYEWRPDLSSHSLLQFYQPSCLREHPHVWNSVCECVSLSIERCLLPYTGSRDVRSDLER